MNLVAEARALMALVSPLTGERAAGTLLVTAADGVGPATLPAGAYCVPVIGGAARYDLLFKTAHAAAPAGGWPVAAGTPVAVVSNLGGAAMNLAAGTPMLWFPAADGVEPKSILGPGGTTGGTLPAGLTAVRQVAFFEELGAANGAEMLTKALVARFPALVLAWESTGEPVFLGRGQYAHTQVWSFYVVTSRADADPARRLEGLCILDAATALLEGRSGVDGAVFSAGRIAILGRQTIAVTPAIYVYRVRFSTRSASAMREYRDFNPWLRTRLDVVTPDPAPDGIAAVVDNEFLMPRG